MLKHLAREVLFTVVESWQVHSLKGTNIFDKHLKQLQVLQINHYIFPTKLKSPLYSARLLPVQASVILPVSNVR